MRKDSNDPIYRTICDFARAVPTPSLPCGRRMPSAIMAERVLSWEYLIMTPTLSHARGPDLEGCASDAAIHRQSARSLPPSDLEAGWRFARVPSASFRLTTSALTPVTKQVVHSKGNCCGLLQGRPEKISDGNEIDSRSASPRSFPRRQMSHHCR